MDLPDSRSDPAAAAEGWLSAADPVAEAAKAGAGRRGRGPSLRHALAEARDLLAQARGDGGYRASLPRALDLIVGHPDAEDLQVTAARLLLEDHDARAFEAWRGVHRRFPDAPEPFRIVLRLTAASEGRPAAEALFRRRFPDPARVTGENPLLSLGYACEELGLAVEAEAAFQRAVDRFPRSHIGWRRLIHLQEARGGLLAAQRSATLAIKACGLPAFTRLHARLTQEIQALESYAPVTDDGTAVSLKALQAVVREIGAHSRRAAAAPRRRLGPTLMVTGSLGSGGAERQLVATTLALDEAIREGRQVGGHDLDGPVSVACRSLAARQDNDFFLRRLTEAGVRVTEYSRLAPYGGDERRSRMSALKGVAELLPPRVREGLSLLVDFIRYESPQVVHIWQDGMVFAAGMAALLAGTPRIVLSVRTLPPTDRVNRWRVELEPIYRALLASPGVVMTANSHLVARRYEDWLGLPSGVIPVIHNGVERLSEAPAECDEKLWAEFLRRTSDATFTLGGVMRLDTNKRPLEWLSIAERLHAAHPRARFVVVGDGALLDQCVEFAARLGVVDRVLFVGRSASVGFWLARMDAFMLLSRYEGMPNVLIEAQLAGVPVITTPAGGAPEAVIEGRTGHVLASAESPDVDEAVACLTSLIYMGRNTRAVMGAAARQWAEKSFSIEPMLHKTVDLFLSPDDAPLLP